MNLNKIVISIGLLHSAALFAVDKTPNFIIILVDDMGWSSLSTVMDNKCPSSQSDFYQTPNIDRFASQSVRFTNGYAAAAVSSPTRYSIQTGQTPARVGHVKIGQSTDKINHRGLPSIPKMLKEVNPKYVAAHFGKWHIGCDPSVMGYDFSDGQTSNEEGGFGQNKWLEITLNNDDPKLMNSITKKSIDFMDKQVADKKPFFLQISHYATHMKFVSTEESYNYFKEQPKGEKHFMASFAAMLYDLDDAIGKVLTKVDELGIADNTYVFFLTDNGGVPNFPPNAKLLTGGNGIAANAPLQRGKWDLFEGGIRVPFMVRGPQIAANTFCDMPIVTYDLLPTIVDIAQSKEKMPVAIDGISFKSALEGNPNQKPRPLYFHSPYITNIALGRPHSAIRLGDYKAIKYWDNGNIQLFNLKNDISEQRDISVLHIDLTNQMENKLNKYLKSVNAITFEEMKVNPKRNKK